MKEGGEKTVFWVARCAASFSFPSGSVLSHIISHDFHLQKKNLNDGKLIHLRFHSFQKVLQSTQFPFLFFHFLELAPAAAGLLLPGSTTFSTSASIPHLSSKAVSHARWLSCFVSRSREREREK